MVFRDRHWTTIRDILIILSFSTRSSITLAGCSDKECNSSSLVSILFAASYTVFDWEGSYSDTWLVFKSGLMVKHAVRTLSHEVHGLWYGVSSQKHCIQIHSKGMYAVEISSLQELII